MPNHQNQTQKTIQPLYLAQANVFIFDKTWSPLVEYPVPISLLYDENRAIYRIISMDLGAETNKKVLINSTLLPFLEFHKTSTTFGHWTDKSTGKIYGIGFHSQFELEAFEDSLKKAQSAIYTLVKEKQQIGDGPELEIEENNQEILYPSGANYKNWSQLLTQVKKTHAKVPTILIPEAVPNNSIPKKQHYGQGEGPSNPELIPKPTQAQPQQFQSTSSQLYSEWQGLKNENDKLVKISLDSATNARKWELELISVQNENSILNQKLDEASAELEELKKQECDFKLALIKWQECIAKHATKLTETLELEKKIKIVSEENRSLELKLIQLKEKEERRRKIKFVTPEDLVRLENYYKTMLEGVRKNLESVLGANRDAKGVFQSVDTLFAKTITDMIGIHGIINKWT
jgi:hypothetical protein